jgi:hypothetical protein
MSVCYTLQACGRGPLPCSLPAPSALQPCLVIAATDRRRPPSPPLPPACPPARASGCAGRKSEGINGELLLRLESGSPEVVGDRWDAALYMAASWDPYELIDSGVAAAAALSGGAQPRAIKQVPAALDGFGWCTWDAFYSTVSAKGLAEGLGSLAAGGIRPQLLIIDDGWQVWHAWRGAARRW